MNEIFDAITNDFNKFMATAEDAFPGFKSKMKAKIQENVDAELLQEDQNLADQIHEVDAKIEDIDEKVRILLHEAELWKEDKANLEEKRAKIHQKWIARHPAHDVRKPEVEKPNLRTAFTFLCGLFEAVDLFNDKPEFEKAFKRFDNVCNARCKSTMLFGYDWTVNDVWTKLVENGQHTIADKILVYWEACNKR